MTSSGAIERLLTATDVAEWLSLSKHTILDMAEDGRLPSFKLGRAVRFRPSEIDAWLESCRAEA